MTKIPLGIESFDKLIFNGGLDPGSLVYYGVLKPMSQFEHQLHKIFLAHRVLAFTTDRSAEYMQKDISKFYKLAEKEVKGKNEETHSGLMNDYFVDIFGKYKKMNRQTRDIDIFDETAIEVNGGQTWFRNKEDSKKIDDFVLLFKTFTFYLDRNCDMDTKMELIDEVYRYVKERGTLGILYVVHRTGRKEEDLETLTQSKCDAVILLDARKEHDGYKYEISVPKIRGRVLKRDVFDYGVDEWGNPIISTARHIA